MSKRRFLIKGGKGKIGAGERQVQVNEIIPIYEDNSLLFTEINTRLQNVEFLGRSNRGIINYDRVPFLQMENDDFSNSVLFFNPSPYAIVKNTQEEFFFGIDKSKPNARFNPQGTVIKLDANLYNSPYTTTPASFYCLANEAITFQEDSRIFYKINPTNTAVASFNFIHAQSYDFSIIREDIHLEETAGNSEFKTIKVSLTPSQLIEGAPVVLIPEQGENTVIELTAIVYRFTVGSLLFNNEAVLKFKIGAEDMFQGAGIVYVSSPVSFIEKFIYPASKLQQKLVENAPLTVVPFSTPPTEGNGSVDFYLTYRVINL